MKRCRICKTPGHNVRTCPRLRVDDIAEAQRIVRSSRIPIEDRASSAPMARLVAAMEVLERCSLERFNRVIDLAETYVAAYTSQEPDHEWNARLQRLRSNPSEVN